MYSQKSLSNAVFLTAFFASLIFINSYTISTVKWFWCPWDVWFDSLDLQIFQWAGDQIFLWSCSRKVHLLRCFEYFLLYYINTRAKKNTKRHWIKMNPWVNYYIIYCSSLFEMSKLSQIIHFNGSPWPGPGLGSCFTCGTRFMDVTSFE